eukprot:TRINITY_DN651_c1_g1_i2.p1 TRINITY_DN651_c1_g1~~TRINITY_DN651_c1_g1_i2.p1  ORF type:complete len:612 (-),score=158.49 TRINITY_DN651_c1_g1_i2:401-2215(-)
MPKRKREKPTLSSLPWKRVEVDTDALMFGTDEPGFLGLEEIDGTEFNVEEYSGFESRGRKNRKKTKQPIDVDVEVGDFHQVNQEEEGDEEESGGEQNEEEEEEEEEEKKEEPKKKSKQKKKKTDNDKEEKPEKKQKKQKTPKEADPQQKERDEESLNLPFEKIQEHMKEWSPYQLHPLLLRALHSLKFFEPTPIQRATLTPAIIGRKDIVGAAQTGSGKTLGFGLPILQRIMQDSELTKDETFDTRKLKALVLCPTRELSIQVAQHIRNVAKFTNIKIASIVGGIFIEKHKRILASKPDILIATPGRLWALLQEGNPYLVEGLTELYFIVLDEADRMVEQGHFKELDSLFNYISTNYKRDAYPDPLNEESYEKAKQEGIALEEQGEPELRPAKTKGIRTLLKSRRQTFVFSATLSAFENFAKQRKTHNNNNKNNKKKTTEKKPVTALEKILHKIPFEQKMEVIDLTPAQVVAETLHEAKIYCNTEEKDYYLYYFLTKYPGRTLVFVNSIDCIHHVTPFLTHLKLPVYSLHAKLQQKQRLRAIEKINEDDNAVIIATDVAARGIDIPRLDHVIHYQLPRSLELYVHRSGRTARASAKGLSIMKGA